MDTTRRGSLRLLPAALAAALVATLLPAVVTTATAAPATPDVVFDDLDDGDASDWGFFGGNNAGGGGGALSDTPQAGTHYLSTGWGGQGSASVFYGGAFRNVADGSVAIPAGDPWFSFWVRNESTSTVDAWTLEVTVREDVDGNGWVTGEEDSARLDVPFTSADADDTWTLVEAPLSAFADQATGGDGTLTGFLDELVLVVSGVAGPEGAAVEVDFDTFALNDGPLDDGEPTTLVFDDMEHGDPFGNGWFAFNGAVGGGGLNPSEAVRPDGGAFALDTGWGSGGTPGFYGGFGRTNPLDLSGADTFSFWINPLADQEYTLEFNLQDDDNGDGAITPADDDEFQFNCVVGPAGPCAVAGGGWQQVTIPLSDFFDDGSNLFGGNGVLDATPANGVLLNVVVAVIGTGTDANFVTDDWVFTGAGGGGDDAELVQDFELELPAEGAAPCTPEPPVGFCTFADGASEILVTTESFTTAPARDGAAADSRALRLDLDVIAFAGYINGFGTTEWTPQDWSTREGVRFWMYGQDTGTEVFVDILENRNPGSTTDDAERHTVSFVDDFSGWQQLEFPFNQFSRKEIGNGAPSDGFDRFEVYGFALGTLGTGGPVTYWLDDIEVYGEASLPDVTVGFAQQITRVEEGETAEVVVRLNRALGPENPDEVSIDFATERSYATPGEEFTPTSGTLTFVKGGPTELTFPVETFDDSKFEGDEQVVLRLTNPVGVERNSLFQGSVLITETDEFDAKRLDDFVQGAFLWDATGADIEAIDVAETDADARPGQDAVEELLEVTGLAQPLTVGPLPGGGDNLCRPDGSPRPGVTPVELLSTPTFDATTVDLATLRIGQTGPDKIDKRTGEPRRIVTDVNGDGLDDLKFHVRFEDTGLPCGLDTLPINAATDDGGIVTSGGSDASFGRDFALGQDWTGTESLDFWFRGAGAGDDVTVTLKDNRAPYEDGPDGWSLVWSDEFDEPAGTVPSEANWSYELGDTTPDAKNGWGNEELQYYTDDPANAQTDGEGNLVMTLTEADGSQECYYGPCEYDSARLISQHKAEFAYGRIESRVLVPDGGAGLWPAVWSLGTDITYNPWPGAGEIDVMEYVSRLPNEIFGTIHGPGYNGGGAFGNIYTYDEPVYTADRADGTPDGGYHTFTVEWEPDLITWYVDDVQYHQATPADVPGPWVFDKPFFLLLNFAIGGNFGGTPDEDNTYPQEFLVDYVRVFQGPDTAERFEASFTDDVEGWQRVSVPVTDFVRSEDQPAGAPDDGLGLTDVWGYGFAVPNGLTGGGLAIDAVERVPFPPPTELVVTTDADTGPGSLREALNLIADGGAITFDPALAGSTIGLTSGELVADRDVTIDGSGAPGLVVSGSNASRVLRVTAGSVVAANDVEIADGVGAPQGGGILNLGDLTLTRVVVRDNVVPTTGSGFDLGGGGIYTGDSASLTLLDSTISNNATVAQPGGGIYGFFNSTTLVENSTITGNSAGDVAGGVRSLGTLTMRNSTVTDNVSAVFHGGGLWLTDGVVTIEGSTITGNSVLDDTAGGIMVATFGAPVTVTVEDSVVGPNGAYNCQVEGGGAAVLTSLGGNVFSDASCNPIDADTVTP